jgi:hypothetical protein
VVAARLALLCSRSRHEHAMQLADILRDSAASEWESHNFALKAFRHRLLQDALGELTFPTEGRAMVMARQVQHDAKGPGFEVLDAVLPWSWKDMLASMKTDVQARVVGTGITSVSVRRRGPKSYDHAFAAVAASKGWTWPGSDREPPPIVDFAVRRSDGTTILVHPRKKRGQCDVIEDGGIPVSKTPAKGYGKSDGRGTFQSYLSVAYHETAFTPGFGSATYPTARAAVAAPAGGGRGGGGASAGAAVAAPAGGGDRSALPAVKGKGRGFPPPRQPPPPPPMPEKAKAPPPNVLPSNVLGLSVSKPPPPPPSQKCPPPPPPRPQQQPKPSTSSGPAASSSSEPAVAAPSSCLESAVAAPSSSSELAVAAPTSSDPGLAVAAPSSSSGLAASSSLESAVAASSSSSELAVAAPTGSDSGHAVAAPMSSTLLSAVADSDGRLSFYVQEEAGVAVRLAVPCLDQYFAAHCGAASAPL